MPVIGGFAVVEMIGTIDPRVPVIVLSADIQKRTFEKVMELGAFRMLRKPRRRRRSAGPSRTPWRPEPPGARPRERPRRRQRSPSWSATP